MNRPRAAAAALKAAADLAQPPRGGDGGWDDGWAA